MNLKELGLQQLTFNINDDIVEVLEAKEGDHKSRGLAIQILKNNEEIDMTGVEVDLYAKPKDGQIYLVRGKETDVTRGMYEIIYPSAILQPGEVEVEIVLTQGEQVISTKKFSLIVEDTLATDDIVEKSDERPLLAILVEAAKNENTRIEAENRRITAENERMKNEKNRQSNEGTREANEDIRKTNEDTRQANEKIRKSQESGRVSAENTRKTNEDSRKSAEATRKANEDKRVSAENTRIKNENARKANEDTRIANENKRKSNMAIVESWIANPEQFDGRDLEFHWSGTKLGVRLEGQTTYQYVDLKGEKGDKGDKGDRGVQGLKGDTGTGLEFNWNGTQLGIRREGETSYQYVNLKGEKGDKGDPGEGSGDMHTTTYDKNKNGIVDRAEVADSVEWGKVKNKPHVTNNEIKLGNYKIVYNPTQNSLDVEVVA